MLHRLVRGRAGAAVALLPLLASPAPAQGLLYEWPQHDGPSNGFPAGDVDGDGVDDVALGSPTAGGQAGALRVRSGATGQVLLAVDGAAGTAEGFGAIVHPLGDVDGDGRGDLAVGAWGASPPCLRAVSGLDGTTLWRVDAADATRLFPAALASLGDLDGDGARELLAGATSSTPGVPGYVVALSGRTGARRYVVTGTGLGPGFGTALDASVDRDGDGISDWVAGEIVDLTLGTGRVTVRSGADGAELLAIAGPPEGGRFGATVASVDDANGDGAPDLLVGSPQERITTGSNRGKARLLSGVDGARLRTFLPEQNLVSYGHFVDAFDDLDGDGVGDLLVSAGSYQIGCCTYYAAELRVYSSVTGAPLYYGSGHTLSPRVVPDANGDGRSDYVVNAQLDDGSFGTALALTGWPDPTPGLCPPKTTSHGCGPRLFATGVPSATLGEDLTLHADQLPFDVPGVFVWSRGPSSTPFHGGTLCVAPPLHRLGRVLASTPHPPCMPGSTTPTGEMTRTIPKSELSALGWLPGEAILVQAWFRDAGFAPPDDVGLTGDLWIAVWP